MFRANIYKYKIRLHGVGMYLPSKNKTIHICIYHYTSSPSTLPLFIKIDSDLLYLFYLEQSSIYFPQFPAYRL